jgi:hypothetical protein
MTVKSQDPFFGSIGGMAASVLGLTGTGIDGQESVPLFRSNLLDTRDPMMSSIEYRMSEAYSRRFADMQKKYTMAMSRSVDSMFNGSSAMGRFFYETNSNGEFVQSPGVVKAFDMLRGFATGPSGAAIINSISNGLLGYDRGAGMNVFAKNIDSIVAGAPGFQRALYSTRADGTMVYRPQDITDEQYQASRTTAASMMNSSLQRVMYNGGMLKDYDTTHGVSEELMARMISDAAMGGRFSQASTMTERDKKSAAEIAKLDDAIKANDSEIEWLTEASQGKNAVASDVEWAQSEIKRLKSKNREMMDQRKKFADSITSFEYGGDLSSIVSEGMRDDANYRRLMKELGSEDEGTGLYGQLKDVNDQIDLERRSQSKGWEKRVSNLERQQQYLLTDIQEKEKTLDGITKAQDEASKKMDPLMKSIAKEMSGAVKTAQAIFGSEQDTYNALYAMTGGQIASRKGVGTMVDRKLQSYIDTGISMGLSNGEMSQLLQNAGMAIVGNRGVAAPYRNDFSSTWAAMRAAEGAARGSKAEGLTDAERGSMPGAANWLAATNDQSTMKNAMYVVQNAYEEGTISENQYKSIFANLTSSDDDLRAQAFRSLSSKLFRGDMKRAVEFLKNEDKMAIVRDHTKDSELVERQFEKGSRAETNASKELAAKNLALNEERKFAEDSGYSSQQVEFSSDSGMIEGMRSKMSDLAKSGNAEAAAVLSGVDQLITDEIRKGVDSGESEEEATRHAYRKASEWMRETGAKVLGESATEVRKAGLDAATARVRSLTSGEDIVGGSGGYVTGDFQKFLSTQDGALDEEYDDKMSKRSMLQTGNYIFGDEGKSLMLSDEEKEAWQSAKEKYREALRNGDTGAALTIMNDFYNSLGDNTKAMMNAQISKNVTYDTKKAQGPGEGKKSTVQSIEDTAAALRSRGETFNTTTYNAMMNSAILQAEKDPEEEARLAKKRAEDEKRAYQQGQPGAESIMDFLTGDKSFVNIFKNGNISDQEFYKRIGDLSSNLGFLAGGADQAGILDLFTKGGSKSASAESIAKGILQLGGENAFSFAKLLGMENDTMWGDDAVDFMKDMDKFQNATLNKDKQKHLSSGLDKLINSLQNDVDKYRNSSTLTSEEKEALASKNQNLEQLKAVKSLVDSGQLDLGGAGGSDRGGPVGQGVSSGQISELIGKIETLVNTLQNQVGEGTYKNG